MNILFIENLSKHSAKLQAVLCPHTVHVCRYDNIPDSTEIFDAIILSGGNVLGALRNKNTLFAREIELIKKTEKPLLGICLGFQLLALANDGVLEQGEKKRAYESVNITEKFFLPKQQYEFYLALRWRLIDAGQLQIIARNSEHIQIITHPTKPHYGVCFHPELSLEIGKKLMREFLKQISE